MRHLAPSLALVALAFPLRAQAPDPHAAHAMHAPAAPAAAQQPDDRALPAGAATVAARVASSPRHGEWAMIARPGRDSMRAWVVYPERRDKAPVVVVIHEIYGTSTWIKGVADQLAAEGYIAIAPDLVTGMVPLASPTDTMPAQAAVAAVRALKPADALGDIELAAEYAMKLPAAQPRWGVVGFCWGGSMSFETAVRANPKLRGAVVYYGTSPAAASLAGVKAPVLGLYGENDARVNATIPAADSTLKALGRRFTPVTFTGAGHGFLRQQDGQNGANLAATREAWPKTVAFFREVLAR
jgi:carboxymethylenebutenolidase